MASELGWFDGTEIGKTMIVKESKYEEYKKVSSFDKKIWANYINNIYIAISVIINQVEQEKLQRKLTLGKDAYIKVKSEIKYLKKDIISDI